MYVAGAVDCERPFSGPLYRFLALHPRNVARRVLSYVSFMLRYLSMQLSESRHCECAETLRPMKWALRVDAQASDIRTGVGVWEPRLNELDGSRLRLRKKDGPASMRRVMSLPWS